MVQRPLFAPPSEWRPTPISQLPSWAGARRVAVDIETRDDLLKKLGPGVRRGGYIVGVSFAIEDGPSYYLPMRHEAAEDNLDPVKVIQYLKDQAKVFRGDIVGANLQYDLDYLAEEGVVFAPRFFRDVQIAEPLIDELQMSYSLDNIALRHGMPGKDEELLRQAAERFNVDPKSGMWRLPGRYVGAYAETDAVLPLELLRKQERIIDDQDVWGIYDLESRCLPVLLKMRRRGVRIDFDQLDRVEKWSLEAEAEQWAEFKRQTGVRVAVGDGMKANALAAALEQLGIKVPTTPTGKPSVKADVLKAIKHPAAEAIMEARRIAKVRTTFVKSIRDHAVNGRVHCTFNQLRRTDDTAGDDEKGARYGRLSSSDPNLQQQPARHPIIGPMWRAIYLPDDGAIWACDDFSQQEPRWLTHYAELKNCSRAKSAADEYRNNPKADNHTMMSRMIDPSFDSYDKAKQKKVRSGYKEIYLGKCYGMGGAKMCHKLGLPTEQIWSDRRSQMIEIAGPEGQALIDRFDAEAPFVKELGYSAQNRAEAVGYIITAGGRRCRFPVDPTGRRKYDWTHKALNRLIQGSSADQTKQALVDADAAGYPIQLQVHDELDFSAENEQQALDLASVMREAMPANVPFRVDVEVGPNWGELTEIS